jgi:hypothetical protein
MSPQRLFSLPFLLLTGIALAGAPGAANAAAPAGQPPPAAAAAAPGAAANLGHRVGIPGAGGQPYPYTIELPAGWQLLPGKGVEGVFLAPAGVTAPESDPRAICVRISPVSLADPDAVVRNIKQNAATDPTWTAPVAEVRQVGGVHGVLVRMDSGAGSEARSTLVLKMPLGMTSLDFIASAPRADFERQLPAYERVVFSVQPVR